MLNEFREFIARGNVIDMAVGIIMGAAFTAVVTSLVQDIFNPVLGLFTGGMDFSGLRIPLTDDPEGTAFAYGNFLMAVINFLIVAWVVFLLVRAVNRLKRMAEREVDTTPERPAGPTEKELLAEIRDALVAQGGRSA